MSEAQQTDAAPGGEEIHLPGPSIVPLINAAALTVALVGLTTFRELTYIGLVVFVWTTIRWIQDSRRDIAELPLDHHH